MMKKKLTIEKSTAFSQQFTDGVVNIMDTKTLLVNQFNDVGITDWEFHLNTIGQFHHNEIIPNQGNPKSNIKKNAENVAFKNTNLYSDYWLG